MPHLEGATQRRVQAEPDRHLQNIGKQPPPMLIPSRW